MVPSSWCVPGDLDNHGRYHFYFPPRISVRADDDLPNLISASRYPRRSSIHPVRRSGGLGLRERRPPLNPPRRGESRVFHPTERSTQITRGNTQHKSRGESLVFHPTDRRSPAGVVWSGHSAPPRDVPRPYPTLPSYAGMAFTLGGSRLLHLFRSASVTLGRRCRLSSSGETTWNGFLTPNEKAPRVDGA